MVEAAPANDVRSSPLERLLSVIAPVRPGEGPTALALGVNVFMLMTAYYMIKPMREDLILADPDGPEFKAYASAGSALLLTIIVPLYDRAVDVMPRNLLIATVTGFFVLCMGGFYYAGQIEAVRGSLAIPFYLWVSVFSMMLVAQFWGFANDIYTEEEGKRIFAIVGLGASLGGATGSLLTSLLLEPPGWWPAPKLDLFQLLILSGSLLVLTVFVTQWVHVRERSRSMASHDDAGGEETGDEPPGGTGGFALVLSNRYLLLLALFSLLFTFVNTNGEYILGKLVSATYQTLPEAEKAGWIGAFYAKFFFYVNISAVLIQSLAVSRIVKHGGLRVAFFVLPILVLFSSILVVIFPVLAILRITKTLENSTDYSLNNTVRNMLWLPTTTEMKYKAKQVVDTVMVRLGDVCSALLVFVAASKLDVGVRGFAITNVALCLLWLWLARRILTENARVSYEHEPT